MPEQTQAFLQSIVDTVREPLIVLDGEARVVLASRTFYGTFNVLEREVISRSLFELGNGQWDIPELRRLLGDVLPQNEVIRDYEVFHTFPGVGPRTFYLNARKLFRPGNHTEMVLLSFEDVTSRRETERIASEARAYAESIVQTVREPLLVLNAQMEVVTANQAFYKTFAVSPEATENRPLFELNGGQWNIPELRTRLETIIGENTAFDGFSVTQDFPGVGRKTLLLNARKLFRPGNHTAHLLLALEDVTALQAADERVRLLFDSSHDFAFLLLDGDGKIREWRGGAESILGWSETEVLGLSCDFIFTPEDRADNTPAKELSEAARTGRAEDKRWHLRKNGTRFFADGVLLCLRDETGELRGYAKVLRDATLRKNAEDALQAAYARERNIASVLQSPLTRPVNPDAFPGLDVVTLYESALDEAEVGGDFFDAFALGEMSTALAVADASGKGLGAAVRAMQVKEVLHAFAQEYHHLPSQIVERLNVFLCENSSSEGFVCLAFAVLDPQTGAGAILSAGCEPPLLLRANNQAEPLEMPGMPLGVTVPQTYSSLPLFMEPGDVLLMATDGITEARQGRIFLGYEGFVRLAQEGQTKIGVGGDLSALGRFILEGARDFGGGRLRDDACLLLARRRQEK